MDHFNNVILAASITGNISVGEYTFNTGAVQPSTLVAKFSPTGKVLWARIFPSSMQNVPNRVSVNSAGDVILSGYFSGSIDFGKGFMTATGSMDAFLLKLNGHSGDTVWSKRFGGSGETQIRSHTVDKWDHIVTVGYFTNNINFGDDLSFSGDEQRHSFIVWHTSEGTPVWAKTLQSEYSDEALDVVTDQSGNIFMVGYFNGNITLDTDIHFNSEGYGVYIQKMDLDGTLKWSRAFVSDNSPYSDSHDLIQTISCDKQGNFVITGAHEGVIDFGNGNPLPGSGNRDIYVAKFSFDGNVLWAKNYTLTETNTLFMRSGFDSMNNVLLSGHFT